MEKGNLVAGEIFFASISVVLASAVLFLPFLMAKTALQDAWISVLVGTAVAVPFVMISISLLLKFPEKSIIEILDELLGSIAGRIVGVVYAVTFLLSSALITRQLEEFMVISLMPETPAIAIRVLFMIVVYMGIYEGALPIVRTNVYVMPVGFIVICLVILLATPSMTVENITPVLEGGMMPVLEAAFLGFAWLCQIPLVLLVFFKYLNKDKLKPMLKYKGALTVVAVGVALLLGALSTMAIFGPQQTSTMYYPSFNMARIISIGGFLEHIEVIFVGVWIAAAYIATTLFGFMAIITITQIIGIGDYKKIVLPTTAALLVLPGFIIRDVSHLIFVLDSYFPITMIALGAAVPLILLLLAAAKKSGQPEDEQKTETSEQSATAE
ncbi:endospore germination permease [Proteinivorax hydrogeniformans]|uniref:Endospore germination permease n=1 Tax=Proteinivorax hydrogeniformans TaxID=1826727 RepID=A0AAU8HW09_9FIRM